MVKRSQLWILLGFHLTWERFVSLNDDHYHRKQPLVSDQSRETTYSKETDQSKGFVMLIMEKERERERKEMSEQGELARCES